MTRSGFDYTAHYDMAAHDSIVWAATFRKNGIYSGRQHGRVFEISLLPSDAIERAVMASIDEVWTV